MKFIDIQYDDQALEELEHTLDEITDNAAKARNILDDILFSDEHEQVTTIRLTADALDALRCVVEDAADLLEPHYRKLDKLWDEAQTTKARKKVAPKASKKKK